jgi:very-short-patch-repair endonuclease
MPECIKCGAYTKYKKCLVCYREDNPKPSRILRETTPKSTYHENLLIDALKKRGIPAMPQKWTGHIHVDIAIPKYKVNIEVDGLQHGFDHKQALSDLKRTYYTYQKGYVTLRIPNKLVEHHLDETADIIARFLKASEKQLEAEMHSEFPELETLLVGASKMISKFMKL